MGVRVGDGGGELVRPSGGKTNRTWREVDGGGVGGVGRREGGANKCELEHLGEGRRLIGRRAGGAGWWGESHRWLWGRASLPGLGEIRDGPLQITIQGRGVEAPGAASRAARAQPLLARWGE